MSCLINLTFLLTVLLAFLWCLLLRPKRIVVSNISDVIALLDPPGSSISQLLLARARPNARLVHAFGLQNTFVSADSMVRKQFVTRAKGILRNHTRNFTAFPDAARSAVAGSVLRLQSRPHHQRAIPFSVFIQVVSLRVVVCSLLGGDMSEESDDGTVFVVEAINDLWALSKRTRHASPVPSSARLQTLNGHLCRWLPAHYERPLDIVIPAYETMWRVIAVTVARAIHDRGACDAFAAYLEAPHEGQFVRFDKAQPQRPSVDAFVCEVLRLHPPSRCLARATPSQLCRSPFQSWTPTTTHVANIEALHRDPAIWGSDAAVFDPMRFHPSRLSYTQKHAFIPFSHGPLRCVAFKEAPRFAAIVAAAILELSSAPDGKYRLVCGERIGRREGWEGWSIEIRD